MSVGASSGTMTSRRPAPRRLLSLDVARGITVALMILVNNAGDGSASYPQLRHSVWNGCTLTDLVFPNFLFIVGASIVLSFSSRLARGETRRSMLRQVLVRSSLLFALGLLLNALPAFHLSELRYFGVLQRIAFCYLLASIVFLAGGARASAVCLVASLAGYWWLMTKVPMPEFGLPAVDLPLLDPTGNLASLLDRMIVPPIHLYHHGSYDPEGLLSTLPAVGTTLLGVLTMTWLTRTRRPTLKFLLAAGVLIFAAGLLWAQSFPLNKRLWTSSYVLFAGGISIVVLALLFRLLDDDAGPGLSASRRRGITPWIALGTNALSAYILSELLAVALAAVPVGPGRNLQQLLFQLLPHALGPAAFRSLLYSVLFVAVCALPILELYRRRIVIKL